MKQQGIKIVVVGSINCDIVSFLDEFPKPNETVFASGYEIAIGGKGLNQAVAASRMGAQVSMIGCVGDDGFGQRAIAHLKKNSVDCAGICTTKSAPTGLAAIAVNEAGDNMISVASGANFALGAEHVTKHSGLIKEADVLLVQAEISVDVIKASLELANQAGVPSILNPAPADKNILPLLNMCTYITPNETEAETLTGCSVQGKSEIYAALQALKNSGANQIVMTRGRRGALISGVDVGIEIASYAVKTVDTTGAGDVFNGVFAAGIAEQLSSDKAARRACAGAALSVMKKTANSAPTRDEIKQFMNKN